MNTKTKGKITEELVCGFLVQKGHEILCRNYFCRVGEIDIISLYNNEIVFTEVKAIPSTWDGSDIAKKIPFSKMHKIKMAASLYLAENSNYKYSKIRFDIALVIDKEITIYEGAF